MRLTLLPLLLLTLSGCTGAKDDTGGGGGNGGDNGGNGGDNGGGGDSGPCGAYNPGVGAVLTYSFVNMGDVTGSYVLTFDSFDAASGAAVFTATSNIASSGYTADTTTVENLLCASDGVYLVSLTTDSNIVSGGTPFVDSMSSTYDPAPLLLPADFGPGSTWEMTSTVTTVDDMSGTGTSTMSQTATAGDEGSVTVPAGDYTAIEVTYAPTSGAESHSWLSKGVGAVQTDSTALSSVN